MLSFCLFCFFFLVSQSLVCSSGTVYVKFTKKTKSWGSEESWEIYTSGSKIYSSPILSNDSVGEYESCLTATTNYQYTIKMKDSYGDSWSEGAWLQVQGVNGNTILKHVIVDSREEELPLSLYSPINKNESWKLTSGSVTGMWTEYSFSDSNWNQVTLGSVTIPVSGTQYFRKQFVGLAGMAAYEASFNYRFGIIAYINGVEIFRDNMPNGTPTSATTAMSSYPTVEYHAIIRPGIEVVNSQSVLAVELHFLSSQGQENVDFNSYLAIYARSVTGEDACFAYPHSISFTTSVGSNVSNMRDFEKNTSFSITSSDLPAVVSLTLTGPKAYLNGIGIFPYTYSADSPNNFYLQGKSDGMTTWANAISVSDLIYETNVFKNSLGYFYTDMYTNYRILFNQHTTTETMKVHEAYPLICALPLPLSIEYDQETYTFYAKYHNVMIRPKITEFTSCTIAPTPPSGLTFDATTCTLSGFAKTGFTTVYTVTSVMNDQPYTGTFTLQISTCSGAYIKAVRTYQNNAAYEGFTIRDAINQDVIIDVQANSGQQSNLEWSSIVCLTGSKYLITVFSSNYNYWSGDSFLYINSIFDSNGNYETILRANYNINLGLPTSYPFNAQYPIKSFESWYYKMGEVPNEWYNAATPGWVTGTAGTFPTSTNQIQLYKKTFSVTSLTDVAGIVISFKYQYGYIIYLNNHEVARKGFTGVLTTSTYSSTSLTDCNYRQISLPIKTMSDGTTPSINYVITGTNIISIGLIAAGPAQTTSSFDAAVRLIGAESASRIWKTTQSYNNILGSPSTIMNFSGQTIYNSDCIDNFLDISFDDDRREWISSVVFKLYYTQNTQQPRNVIIKAKNPEDTEWTTIKTVTGMTWSLMGQANKIWLTNNKAYNQYRFENFATGSTTECYWKLSQIDLRSDATNVNVPTLSYPVISVYKDIELAEIYPSSNYYTNFSISPSLPVGVVMDPYSGIISGSAHAITSVQTYTISAKKYNTGETVTAQLSLTVEICTGGKSLITLVARSDSSPQNGSWSLFQGRFTNTTAIQSVDALPMANALNYGDFCLNHTIYTLELKSSYNSWSNPAGYYLTVDVGEMKFEMGYVNSTSVTTMFSSYLPFQIEYDNWKIFKNTVADNWNTIDYDDSTWTVTKAAQIGTNEAVTTYIRRDVTLDDVATYQVLNVRVKYAGGVVAYFNGRKVARFNLDDGFDEITESLTLHPSTGFSRFHIVLATVGAVTGKNIIAFEIHRPVDQSSSEPVIFDATGVFGVNDCSIGVDTIINVSGSTGYTIGDLENFFDLTPVTYGYQSNSLHTYLQWTVENLEGSKFNSFALQTVYSRSSWGFSLYGRDIESLDVEDPDVEEYFNMFSDVALTTFNRGRSSWDVPAGLASFRQFKHEVDDTASSTVYISAYIFQYCKVSGDDVCPGIDDYPPVHNGQISYGDCPYGYRGYSYRTCNNSILGPVEMDHCIMKPPMRLRYDNETFILYTRIDNVVLIPHYQHIVSRFYLAENSSLPVGLTLHEANGTVTGIPEDVTDMQFITICGENAAGFVCVTIGMHVLMGIPYPPSGFSYPIVVEGWMNANTSLYGVESTPIGKCQLCTYTHIDGDIHGFSLDSNTGRVYGACTSQNVEKRGESTAVTIKAENESGSANATLHIICYGPPGPFSYTRTSYFVWINQEFTTTAPSYSSYSWYNITSGELPTGLVFDPLTGEIKGTPTAASISLVEVIHVNPAGHSTEYVYIFVVDFKVIIAISLFIVFVFCVVLGLCCSWINGIKLNKKRGKKIMPIRYIYDAV